MRNACPIYSFICLLNKAYQATTLQDRVRRERGEECMGKCKTNFKISNNKYVCVSQGNKKVLK